MHMLKSFGSAPLMGMQTVIERPGSERWVVGCCVSLALATLKTSMAIIGREELNTGNAWSKIEFPRLRELRSWSGIGDARVEVMRRSSMARMTTRFVTDAIEEYDDG